MTSGILIVDKPQDWTSHDVVAKLRRVFGEKRIGHAGTLDPMATGVLPVFLGRATRAVEFATEGGKTYQAGLKLGTITDTQDTTGTILESRDVSVDKEDLLGIFPQFSGEIQQIPPMYSAIKIQGKKLYELARKGKEIPRPPRNITIHQLRLLSQNQEDSQEFLLEISCSKGTYIRTLCHDMGQVLGCGGTMSSLRRTSAAGYTLAQAHPLEDILKHPQPKDLLLPVDSYFKQETFSVEPWQEQKIRNGSSVPLSKDQDILEGEYRVYGKNQTFLALCQVDKREIHTIKSFFEVESL